MRPVDKGAAPTEAFTRYADAAAPLIERLGRYCSYCERQIETHLAVEHVRPKLKAPELSLSWSNFLLACSNCNSCKGASAVVLSEHFWPDRDNTLRAFEYTNGGLVRPSAGLSEANRARAEASIALLGLDRYPGSPTGGSTEHDLRWSRRREVWALAAECVSWIASADSPELRQSIVDNAVARGMFSIWWTAFAADEDMRRRLREAFVGTDPSSFDASERLSPRPGGLILAAPAHRSI